MRACLLLALAFLALPAHAVTQCKAADSRGVHTCTTTLPAPALAKLQEAQRGRNWCWAAAVSMLLRHWGRDVDQETIVQEQFGELLDAGATADEIIALLHRPRRDGTGRMRSLSAQLVPEERMSAMLRGRALLRELKGNRPLVFGHTAHAVVLVGATYERPRGRQAGVRVRTVTVIDPADPRRLVQLDLDAVRPQLLARVTEG